MKYVLVCNLKGDVVEYHKKLVKDIYENFGVLRPIKQKIEPHLTLKYPFDVIDLASLESLLASFCAHKQQTHVRIGGFGDFNRDVVFLKTILSVEACKVHERLISQLKAFNWMSWEEYDGEKLNFHATIASNCRDSYAKIQNYLTGKEQYFDCVFDNITILKEDVIIDGITTWKQHAEFKLL